MVPVPWGLHGVWLLSEPTAHQDVVVRIPLSPLVSRSPDNLYGNKKGVKRELGGEEVSRRSTQLCEYAALKEPEAASSACASPFVPFWTTELI